MTVFPDLPNETRALKIDRRMVKKPLGQVIIRMG